MSACEQPLVYTTDPTDAPRRDFTAEIAAADSPEDQRKLLAEKQAALELRHPRRGPTEPKADPVIPDPQLLKLYERSKAREERRASRPVVTRADLRQAPRKLAKKVAATPGKSPKLGNLNPAKLTAQEPGPEPLPYAHGLAMRETLAKVCMRPDLSSKAKHVALTLASHYPHVKPSIGRLMLLTGIRSDQTVSRALRELRSKGLLRWKSGSSAKANEYTCVWLAVV